MEETHEHNWGPIQDGFICKCLDEECNTEVVVENETWEQLLELQIIFDM